MTPADMIAKLWEAQNVIAGFAAVQALAFSYACARKDFGDAINTRKAKLSILAIFSCMAAGYVGALAWAADHQASLDPTHSDIYWQAAAGRILFVLGMTSFWCLALYARQLFSKQPLRT
jgi:hypothetical protein